MSSEREGLRAAEALLNDGTASTAQLSALWRGHEAAEWEAAPHLYAQLARRFLRAGDPLLAHEVLSEARDSERAFEPRLQHLYGLVLARSGATERAAALARDLRHDVRDDPVLYGDVMGLLGRTEKDFALHAGSATERRRHLRRALAIYRGAFHRTQQSYNAINAATLALLLGREEAARSLSASARAAAVREQQELARDGRPTYWQEATLGEAALILAEDDRARQHYAAAAKGAAGELSDLSSMRRQARLILEHRGTTSDWLDAVFGIPRAAVFACQRITPSDSATAPDPSTERTFVSAINAKLESLDIGFGYASAASDGEILFLEAVQARGGQTTVVLPCARDEFTREYVDPAWRPRFDRVLAASVEVTEASRSAAGSAAADYAALLLVGLAGIQSQVLDTQLVPLAVWDGVASPDSPAATIQIWRAHGHAVQILPPPSTSVHA